MSILFVTWAGGGNSTPVLGLATRLARRAHDVKVVSPDDATARFAAVGIDYELLDSVTDAIERLRPSVVVVDFMIPAWMCEVEAAGSAWVALVHTLYDRVGAGILTAFTTLDEINAQRVAAGLDSVSDASELLDRAARVLVTAPSALDTAMPSNGRHIGAVLEEAGPDAGWQPPPGDTPLIVVSPGTTQGLNEESLIETTLDAISGLPVRAVVNVGEHIDRTAFRVPPNATIEGYVRHAAVMPHAAAMVTHAGLGSIAAALSYGLATVCIPLGRDQHHNAARVAAVGAGVTLSTDASVTEIRGAVERILSDPSFAAAARPFRDEYDPTAQSGIDELEALL